MKTYNFRERRNTKKKNKSKYLIKSFSLIFLSLIFLYMQIQFEDSKETKEIQEIKEIKENLIHKIHIAINTDNKYVIIFQKIILIKLKL